MAEPSRGTRASWSRPNRTNCSAQEHRRSLPQKESVPLACTGIAGSKRHPANREGHEESLCRVGCNGEARSDRGIPQGPYPISAKRSGRRENRLNWVMIGSAEDRSIQLRSESPALLPELRYRRQLISRRLESPQLRRCRSALEQQLPFVRTLHMQSENGSASTGRL
jgi:hypothetical protein